MATPNSDREPSFLISLLMQPLVWGSLLVLLGSSVMAWAYWRNPGDLRFSQGDGGGGAGDTWRPEAVDVEEIAAGIDSSNILAQQMRAAELMDGEALGLERSDQDKKEPEADSAAEILKRLSGPVAGPIGERTTSDMGDVVPERIQFGEGESVNPSNSLGGFRADGQFVPSAPGVAPAGDPLRAAMDRFNAVQAQSGAGRPAIAPGAVPAPGPAYNNTVPMAGGGSSYGLPGAGAYNNTSPQGGVNAAPPMVGVPDGRLPASSSLVPPAAGMPVGGGFTNRGSRDGSSFAPPPPAPVTQDTRSATDSGAPLPQDVPTPNNIGGRSFNSFSNPYDTQR